MSKKVLIISGSPRKQGNSDILSDQFMLGAKESGNEVEKVSLREIKVHPCIGCNVCRKKGECFQKDDMAEVLKKMLESDVIVMATPVYFDTMVGQMKIFIDRTYPKFDNIKDKEFYFIITGADSYVEDMKATIQGLRGFTKFIPNPTEKGIVYGVGVNEKGEVKNTPAMEQALMYGRNA